jgi:predicted flavoprotein YhiN
MARLFRLYLRRLGKPPRDVVRCARMQSESDIVVIGAGAAGLMAAIHAARTRSDASILVLDGARKLGAKILIAGGGRCNVTHDVVDENAFAGSSRNAIRKVLRRFDVPATTAFFDELGVKLKREETGKLFPVTDDARTVLNALLGEARERGCDRSPIRGAFGDSAATAAASPSMPAAKMFAPLA